LLLASLFGSGVNVSGSPFRAYDYAYDPAGNRTQKVVTLTTIMAT
jgi:hypothetical protein